MSSNTIDVTNSKLYMSSSGGLKENLISYIEHIGTKCKTWICNTTEQLFQWNVDAWPQNYLNTFYEICWMIVNDDNRLTLTVNNTNTLPTIPTTTMTGSI